jgi:DNA-binding response OmpR family regulator
LLVEEADVVAEVVCEVLRDEGYAVERASTPGETLALLSRRGTEAYNLVLSAPLADPHKAAYAWLDRLRATTRAPIAIFAGYPAARYADHRQRGYDAYLEAPFDLDDLIALVRRLEVKGRA